MMYVLPLYGTCLVLLVVSSLFFFFMIYRVDSRLRNAGILILFGSVIFYVSDSFLAHGKFNTSYIDLVGKSGNAYIIMITYYVCQYLLGTAALAVSDYCS